MTAIDKQPARHEIEELLPWYATGTLSGRDAERVAQALAGDHELAQRYELVRRELAEATRLNETLGAPSARAMEKLFAAINARGGACAAPSASADQWNAISGIPAQQRS
jgi:anti-sigma-K factor RskA